MTAETVLNATYIWTNSSGTIIGTGTSITVSPTITSTYMVTSSDGCGCVTPTSVTVTVITGCKITGLENHSTTSDDIIKIFPNPNNGLFTVEINSEIESDIDIYSMIGQKVASYSNDKEKYQNVDISKLPDGIYIVKVKINDILYSQKIIKNNP